MNIVEHAMIDAMNASSASLPNSVDEFSHAGVENEKCQTINCHRVANAPAALECRVTHIFPLEGEANFAVFGEIIGIHLRDDCLVEGIFDITKFTPLARLGYRDYTTVENLFSLSRPND